MITTAPLPAPLALLGAAFGAPPGDDAVCASWRRPGDRAMLLSRSAWSLALLAAAAGSRRQRRPRVMVPDWFCAQSLGPLRRAGADIVFAPVGEDMIPRWTGEADLVVAVHSFGRAADMAAARAFADAAGAWLVEDAAHALGPAPGIGETGDAVLYSPHKTLALPAGAVLVMRGDAVGLPEFAPLPPAASPLAWLVRRLVQSFCPDVLRPLMTQGGLPRFEDDPPPAAPEPETAVSALARRLMARADLAAEAAARRANAGLLRRALADMPGWEPLFPDDGPAPYRFALRCRNAEVAAERYARIRAACLPVESWPDLDPAVMASPGGHPGAHGLRRTILLLPVHGALDGRRYARLLRKALT